MNAYVRSKQKSVLLRDLTPGAMLFGERGFTTIIAVVKASKRSDSEIVTLHSSGNIFSYSLRTASEISVYECAILFERDK